MNHVRAQELVLSCGGPELLERLIHLETAVSGPRFDFELPPVLPGDAMDFDVIFAGGGLALLVACALAKRGLRVLVCDRVRAGVSHREWNASDGELAVLLREGILNSDELEGCVSARYTSGFCQFAEGPRHTVRGALDVAIDASRFLTLLRNKACAWGVTFADGTPVDAFGVSNHGVRVGSRSQSFTARVWVDARGASSPFATPDLVCPTVGGVMTGIDKGPERSQIDRNVGEILVTTEPVVDGVQHVWEAFPGKPDETTVYLFAYLRRDAAKRKGLLLSLYARFFETLPQYKRGATALLRPTFGIIPGWSRITPAKQTPHPRIVLVGDAAARHSPLTFCGFGSMLRSFGDAARHVEDVVSNGKSSLSSVSDSPLHAWTGRLASIMAAGSIRGNALNELLDVAFGTLADMGNESYSRLLRDEMSAAEFRTFVQRTASKHPRVYGDVLLSLGPVESLRWAWTIARASMRGPSAVGA